MTLQPPKRTETGYLMNLEPFLPAPELQWKSSGWNPTQEWFAWAETQRAQLLEELQKNVSWFSKPPRAAFLASLFHPWVENTGNEYHFVCSTPDTPGEKESSGLALWNLEGIVLSSKAISPVWTISSFKETPAQKDIDQISLFGDDGTEETREIRMDEIENAPSEPPTKIRNREWEGRKFLAKERVRESRLKAQIACRVAQREETRFYSVYGDLEDSESQFSDYDLTDEEDTTLEDSEQNSPVETA
jgi:hypothetical protein